MKSREECLQILGLKSSASPSDIKASYHDLVKVWHPDRFSHDPLLAKKAEETLKAINEAYQALMQPSATTWRDGRDGPRASSYTQSWKQEGGRAAGARRNPLIAILLLFFGALIVSFLWSMIRGSSKSTKTHTYLQQIV